MSTGAELSVVAVPVGAIGVVLAAGAIAAAGIAVVGGVAVVGTGRLMLAAGSYVRDRMQERAELCAGEYERFLRLRARAKEQERAAVKPVLNQELWHRHVVDEAAAPLVAAPIVRNLTALQDRHDELLRRTARQAQLAAALAIHEAVLAPDLAGRTRVALSLGGDDALELALSELRGAISRANLGALARAQADLGEHRLEVVELLAQVIEPGLHAELATWHSTVNAMLGSRDIAAIQDQLRRGRRLLTDARERHDVALHQLRAEELKAVWGLLQAVDGLVNDLQLLAQSDEHAELLRREAPDHAHMLAALVARYEQLAAGQISDVAALRAAAAELQRELEVRRDAGLQLLNRHYQGRIAAEVAASLREMCSNKDFFTTFEALPTSADGAVAMQATDGTRTLKLQVRADGRVTYDADGFGDETCLGAVYNLRTRLVLRGVAVEMADPQLKPQMAVALQALEAITGLGIYPAETITIQRSGSAIVIEAGAGTGFQRQLARVDRQGQVAYDHQLPQLDQAGAERVVQGRVATQRSKARNRQRELERREQRERTG